MRTGPAKTLPNLPAIGALAPKNANDRFLIRPGRQVIQIRATTLDIMSGPPIPDMALATLTAIILSQNPLINDHCCKPGHSEELGAVAIDFPKLAANQNECTLS